MGTLIIFGESYPLRIIAKKILRDFWELHPDCEEQLKSWYLETSKANWKHTKDIKSANPSASFLSNNRIVFNIKGNSYRIIVKVVYGHGMVWIRFVGTHTEYDKIDANKI